VRTLSCEDAFFLYMETPDQHQHVVATLILEPASASDGVDIDALIDRFEQFTRARPEYAQKLVKTTFSLTPPVLVEDADYAFRNHIHRIAVPAPGTIRQLAMIVEDIASVPLSHRRPLWQAWFMSGLDHGRAAIVLKFHHCLADGVNGTASMLQLFDLEPEPASRHHAEDVPKTAPPAWLVNYRAMLSQWRYQPRYYDVVGRTVRCLGRRRKLFARSKSLGELVPGLFEEAPRLKFNTPITANRVAAMGSLSLADVKRIKNALGVTVNDVVVSLCTMALRDYLIATDDLPDQPLICCQPVSLALKGQDARKADQGNQVGVMSVRLPVQIDDLEELVKFVCNSTKAAKTVFDESFENLMLNYLGIMPPYMADWTMKSLLHKKMVERSPTTCNVVISNLPGPPVPLYVAGAKLEAGYGMGPIISGQGPNITFSSYADKLQYSLLACREQVSDIWLLADAIESAYARLMTFALPEEKQPAGLGQEGGREGVREGKKSAPARTRSAQAGAPAITDGTQRAEAAEAC